MAQQFIHSDFMSVLSSGIAHAAVNGSGQTRDILDGILLYVAFDDAVSRPVVLNRPFCNKCFVTFTANKKLPWLAQVTQPFNYVIRIL